MEQVKLRTIFGTYFAVVRRYWISGTVILLVYALGIIANDVFLRLAYRDLFDLIATTDPSQIVWGTVTYSILSIGALIVTYNILWRIGDFTIVRHQPNVLRELTNEALELLQRHSYNFFIGNFTGSLVAKLRRFVTAFETMEDRIFFNFWWNGILLVGTTIVLGREIPIVAIFFVGWCIVHFTSTYFFMRYRRKFDLKVSEEDSKVTGEMADAITNILNMKMFTSSENERRRFHGATNKQKDALCKAWYLDQWHKALMATTMAILEIVGIYLVLQAWRNGEVTAGTVVLVQMLFYAVMTSTWEIGRAMRDFFRALADATEMIEILEKPIEVSDPKTPEESRIEKGNISFTDAYFHYIEDHDVLSCFTLDIPSGQKVGIVGHSGVGKSTLFKLILRFLDVSDGSITIDSQDIRSITQDDLRKNISYVPQDPILFHRSLYENIAYARQDATKEEVIDAAKRAHAHEFIASLPKGYETLVGERGVKLSGGERQRVAIARVILKNAPILLLDEATSSLDSVSEKYIQEKLKELMKSRTTLAIAHRISTIKQMDRIIVLEEGKIVEDGSHEELLSQNGVYTDFWSHQSQGFLVE